MIVEQSSHPHSPYHIFIPGSRSSSSTVPHHHHHHHHHHQKHHCYCYHCHLKSSDYYVLLWWKRRMRRQDDWHMVPDPIFLPLHIIPSLCHLNNHHHYCHQPIILSWQLWHNDYDYVTWHWNPVTGYYHYHHHRYHHHIKEQGQEHLACDVILSSWRLLRLRRSYKGLLVFGVKCFSCFGDTAKT